NDLISVPPEPAKYANKGEDVPFVCKISVPPHLKDSKVRIRWKLNGVYIHPNKSEKFKSESDGQVLIIKNVDTDDAGLYACVVDIIGDDVKDIDKVKDIASGRLYIRVPPDPPKYVTVVSCLGNTAELSWQPGENGGAEISSYLVQFNTSDNPKMWNNYYEEIPPTVRTTHIHLSPWGMYSIRMLAKNSAGYSDPSLPTKKTCTTPPDHPGGNPKDVRSLTHKKNKLIVTWTPMPKLLHNGPGFKYEISWRKKGSTYWNKDLVMDPNANTWEVDVNDTFGLYEFKVKAENDIGESYQPAFKYVGHSGEAEPLVVPKDFRLDPTKPVDSHKANFIWEAVNTDKELIKGAFKGYKLRYWKSSEGRHKWIEVDIVMDKESHSQPDIRASIENLPAYTALRAQVSVMNTHYTGPPSQIIDFFTPEGKPGPVRNLHIEATGATYALLKWLPPEEPNGIPLGYDIGYQPVVGSKMGPIKTLKPHITNPDTLGARITGLTANHNYRFYVWARTAQGHGEHSFLDVKTADGQPPNAPNPRYTSLTQTSINITWTPYEFQEVSYQIEYREIGTMNWVTTEPIWNHSWKVLDGLRPGTEYEVRVIAQNKYGDTATRTLYRVMTQHRKGTGDANFFQADSDSYSRAESLHGEIIPLSCRSWSVLFSILLIFILSRFFYQCD
ncbi:hypothetical protein ACJMK2_017217, partial [Sinanodonta woodiana]